MKKLVLAVATALALSATAAQARDNIEIVGSSTVYPFTTTVAEQFSKKTGSPAPKVESTGTGGGMKLFCAGAGVETPDLTNASRRMKKSEFENCQKNGVDAITEIHMGYDGLTIAQSKSGPEFKNFSLKDLYMALAKEIPNEKGELVANPYKMWNEVNPELPAIKIEVIGPPPTSGTRDSFNELGMEGGCKKIDSLKALHDSDKKKFESVCRTIREDGAYIEAGENDNLIVQKLETNANALGAFGFSFLEQNEDKLNGLALDGVKPSPEAVIDKTYPMSRAMYVYVKNSHVDQVKGIKEFVAEYVSTDAMGEDGYLADKGLVTVPADKLPEIAKNATAFTPMKGDDL
ncbi:substrate-binding domain-containing protein [Thiothrix winogradskyi]|uniref:Substrate-binding domain-containing protein n=1 Tax=Thiothrix winogradskyi TaxID=96472 RepID=A0ABY3T852_9GAMM|nr:substrate-binding domain-containing protein [Thiothrix winogradskyi]UJS26393.1 substrate-binding domain-containing protein [Thiothrix winogradskyi]